MNINTDFVLPFQLENAAIRGRFVRLKGCLKEILDRHNYPPLVNRMLEELVALGVGLANLFKFEGVFTLQVSGDGPLRLMVVDVTHEGEIRACARFDEQKVVDLPLSTNSIHSILGSGYLAFTIDQNDSDDRYQGIVELSGRTLTDCLHHFFRQSDQLETGLVVFAQGENRESPGYLAASLIIQRMPVTESRSLEVLEKENDAWLRALSLIGTATAQELLSVNLTGDDILYRLFWEEGVRTFERRLLIAKCRCSGERILQMLRTFSAEDIEEMIENNEISVTCEFCSQAYTFDPQTVLPKTSA